jgi:hypothetical protein
MSGDDHSRGTTMATSRASLSSLPTCTGGDPPMCCTPHDQAEWDRRGELLAAARQRSQDAKPETCPGCGSDLLIPCFPGPEWSCDGCGLVFEVRDGD